MKKKMDKLKNKILLIIILRWIARIWSISSIAFISFMVIGHIVGEESGTFNSLHEVVQFLFFPSGVYIGMIIAWKWEGLGGIITIISIVAFHMLRHSYSLDFWIDGLSTPGLLFLGCFLLSRDQ